MEYEVSQNYNYSHVESLGSQWHLKLEILSSPEYEAVGLKLVKNLKLLPRCTAICCRCTAAVILSGRSITCTFLCICLHQSVLLRPCYTEAARTYYNSAAGTVRLKISWNRITQLSLFIRDEETESVVDCINVVYT